MKRVLIVDDDHAMGAMLRAHLSKRGFAVSTELSAPAALQTLATEEFDAIVTDLNMREMNGIELCRRVVEEVVETPVIVITAFGSMETAIQAIRAGAYDFVPKPFEVEALVVALDRAVEHKQLRREVRSLRRAVETARRFDEILGESASMRRVFDLVDRVKDSDASVLVTGESGTGKELVARALHRLGRRRDGPFVAVNCAAMPAQLLESELFGHVKGAFTDARSARVGLFAEASGGTLFLDEIGELPVELQPKLLRALQERRIRRVGADAETPVDVRVVAATNRDLEKAVEERRFREDLYYRVNVIHLELPPLAARENDVLLLAQSFLDRAAAASGRPRLTLSPSAAGRLLAYGWPGNVRELQNAMERAVALAQRPEIGPEDLPDKIRSAAPRPASTKPEVGDLLTITALERRHIERVLAAVEGNKSEAARILGLDRTTLYRKLEKYGLAPARPE